MEFIFEILFQFLAELVIQFFGELLMDFGLRSLVDGHTARRHPVLSFSGSVLLGVIAGIVSLLLFKEHFLPTAALRVAALLLVPSLAGWAMSLVGKWQEKRGGERAGLERFVNGFGFALAMSLIRFAFAR
ncbi:hypothetical protein LBMAG56_08110 [Verrucomicrobiota bacterium]|nr:hypothetical protein LBMAG56_08110 [Verrucomicrobiota bacterium]